MKKLLTIGAGVLLCLGADNAAAGLDDGLAAHYQLDGNAQDASGYGNHGTVFGATLTEDRFGNANNAYHFDGVDDYINVPDATMLRPAQLTVAAWINPFSFSQWATVLMKSSSGSWSDGYGIAHYEGTNNMNFFTNSYEAHKVTGTVDIGSWYHITGTYDGSSAMKLYINGQLVGLISYSSTAILHSTNPLFIGKGTGDYFWDGKIDEVRFYNRDLSECEIQSLYEGINVCETEGECTLAELDAAYQQGFTDGTATCSESGTCQPATLSSDLKMHVPVLHYTPFLVDTPIVLWADFELSDVNSLLFKVTDYGVKEE